VEGSVRNKSNEGGSTSDVMTGLSETSFMARSDTAVNVILPFAKGFACAYGLGTVHLFEKSDENYFNHIRSVTVTLCRFDLKMTMYLLQFVSRTSRT